MKQELTEELYSTISAQLYSDEESEESDKEGVDFSAFDLKYEEVGKQEERYKASNIKLWGVTTVVPQLPMYSVERTRTLEFYNSKDKAHFIPKACCKVRRARF